MEPWWIGQAELMGQLTEAETVETQVEPKRLVDTKDPGVQGGVVTSGQGGAMVPEDRGRARGKEEPNGAKALEGQGTAEGLEDNPGGRAMTEQGGAGVTRKSCGARRMTVPGRAEGARSQGEAEWSMGQGGMTALEIRGGALGRSWRTGSPRWFQAADRSQ